MRNLLHMKFHDLSQTERITGKTLLMPKKRFPTQYSKPPSTVHPSLSSTSAAGNSSASNKDGSPSVNELINSSRKAAKPSGPPVALPTPTLPPQIRHLLAQPDTPSPSPRSRPRRRVDANGRPLPAGPPPPRSWLERSRHAPEWMKDRGDQRVFPNDLHHLPGLQESNRNTLQTLCMRQMAKHWEYIREWEQNNLAELPTKLRMELLSYIAIEGPDDGVGFKALKSIVVLQNSRSEYEEDMETVAAVDQLGLSPKILGKGVQITDTSPDQWDAESPPLSIISLGHNDLFFRLDLSGSVGRSVSLKQLMRLFERPSQSVSPAIPLLTHLSLAYPPPTISWRGLLSLSNHIPTLTHLSLAYWPTPTLTPNSRAAVMSSPYGKDIQYGGTNFYSHTLDNDFREAADVLRRLASRLYGLEYLDLTGCSQWFRALRWTRVDANPLVPGDLSLTSSAPSTILAVEGVDWRTSWLKLSTLKLNTDISLTQDAHFTAVSSLAKGVQEAKAVQKILAWWMKKGGRNKRGLWVDVVYESLAQYDDFWTGGTTDERKNRALMVLMSRSLEVDSEIGILNELLGHEIDNEEILAAEFDDGEGNTAE